MTNKKIIPIMLVCVTLLISASPFVSSATISNKNLTIKPNTTEHRFLKGDINNDGMVNFDDINPFVYALNNGIWKFYHRYPHGNYWNADINNDGTVNQKDVNPFVAILSHSPPSQTSSFRIVYY